MENKVTFKKWSENIRKARQYVSSYDKVRFVIAGLALEVCDYSHGGRKGESIFSVRKFAEEIDVDRKTLYEWIRCKRYVVDKLPKQVQNNIKKYKYEDLSQVLQTVGSEASKKEVYSCLQMVMKIDPTTKRFGKYLKHLKSVAYNCGKPMNMTEIPEELMNEIIGICKVIISGMEREIELRKRLSPFQQKAKKLNLDKEISRRLENI